MAFTFPVDTNSKAGAVRQNPVGEGFHLPSVLYGADGVSPSKVRIKNNYNPAVNLGSAYVLAKNEEKVFVANHEFKQGTASWGLGFTEYNRPSSEVLSYLKIKVVMSDTPDLFNVSTGGHEVTFSKTFDLSMLDEVDKGLIIPQTTDATSGSNILLIGKPFNMPLGKYMKVSLINTYVGGASFYIKGFNVIEEGWY